MSIRLERKRESERERERESQRAIACNGLAYLSAEGDSTWLTFSAYSCRPRRVVHAACLDLAAEVFQVHKLPLVHSADQLADVAVEGEVLHGCVQAVKVALIPGIQRGTVYTAGFRPVVTP